MHKCENRRRVRKLLWSRSEGAPPTASDRILASAFGVYAVDLLNQENLIVWLPGETER